MIEINGTVIKVKLDDTKFFEYDYTNLRDLWSYATEDVEHISVKLDEDKLCIAMNAEKGQTGIVAVIDIKTGRLLNWFEAPYAICATQNENMIYALSLVTQWGKEPYNYINTYNTHTKVLDTLDFPYEGEYGQNAMLHYDDGELIIEEGIDNVVFVTLEG